MGEGKLKPKSYGPFCTFFFIYERMTEKVGRCSGSSCQQSCMSFTTDGIISVVSGNSVGRHGLFSLFFTRPIMSANDIECSLYQQHYYSSVTSYFKTMPVHSLEVNLSISQHINIYFHSNCKIHADKNETSHGIIASRLNSYVRRFS